MEQHRFKTTMQKCQLPSCGTRGTGYPSACEHQAVLTLLSVTPGRRALGALEAFKS